MHHEIFSFHIYLTLDKSVASLFRFDGFKPLGFVNDRADQYPDAFNLSLNFITTLKIGARSVAHSRWSTGRDQVARLKRDELRDERNDRGHGKNHLARRAILFGLSIDAKTDLKILRIHILSRQDTWPDW